MVSGGRHEHARDEREVRVWPSTYTTPILVTRWLVLDGGTVRAGDIVVEVEDQKATMELECEADSVLRHLVPAEAEVEEMQLLGRIEPTKW